MPTKGGVRGAVPGPLKDGNSFQALQLGVKFAAAFPGCGLTVDCWHNRGKAGIGAVGVGSGIFRGRNNYSLTASRELVHREVRVPNHGAEKGFFDRLTAVHRNNRSRLGDWVDQHEVATSLAVVNETGSMQRAQNFAGGQSWDFGHGSSRDRERHRHAPLEGLSGSSLFDVGCETVTDVDR